MENRVDSPLPRLIQLENDLRLQVFTVIYHANWYSHRTVREVNELSLALCQAVPTAARQDLVRAKNEEIKRFWWHAQSKIYEIRGMYVYLRSQLQAVRVDLRGDERNYIGEMLSFDTFKKARPALFHQSMLEAKDPDLAFFPFHLTARNTLPVSTVFERYIGLDHHLKAVRSLKKAAKQLLVSNEATDGSEVLEACRNLSNVAVEPIHVFIEKWSVCIQSGELFTSQVFAAKALLYQALASRPRAENSVIPELPFEAEIEAYAETCFTNATTCRGKDQFKQSGYWLSIMRKLQTALGRYSHGVETFYGQALRNAGKYSQAKTVFKSVLRYLQAEEYDDGSKAVIMQLIANTYDDLYKTAKKVKWYNRVLDLGLGRNTEAIDLFDLRLHLSYAYTNMFQFEESERVLISLNQEYKVGTGMCNGFGFLYLTWEKFANSEKWLKKGISMSPKSQGNVQLNLNNLYFKLGNIKQSEAILLRYLQEPGMGLCDRAYAMASMSRICLDREEYSQAKRWLDKAEALDKGWESAAYQQARRRLLTGIFSIEIGEYDQAKAHLSASYEKYRALGLIEQTITSASKLAEAQLLNGHIPEAEAILASLQPQLEQAKGLSASAVAFEMMGRVHLSREQFTAAREWLERTLQIQEEVIPATKIVGRTCSALGCLELAEGRYTPAYERFTQALQIMGDCVGSAEAFMGLAEMYIRAEDWQSAQACLQSGLALFQAIPAHPIALKLQAEFRRIPPT